RIGGKRDRTDHGISGPLSDLLFIMQVVVVEEPARNMQTHVTANVGGQQRMVDTAEIISADQQDGRVQLSNEIGKKFVVIERDQEAARSLYDDGLHATRCIPSGGWTRWPVS